MTFSAPGPLYPSLLFNLFIQSLQYIFFEQEENVFLGKIRINDMIIVSEKKEHYPEYYPDLIYLPMSCADNGVLGNENTGYQCWKYLAEISSF